MFTYAIAAALATAVAARTSVEPVRNRRWRWLAAITLTSGFATVLAVRALQHGHPPALVVALTATVAYVTWPLLCRPTTRPHWTVAAVAASVGLMFVGYGATVVLTSGWLWGDIALALIGLAIVGVASVAWGIVGSLWLRHRAHLDAVTRAVPLPTAATAIAALPLAAPPRALPAGRPALADA
ncbi:hypothetical protein [Cryptosporangium arvum]|uniref:hypothetical protein n=1 Tax=Cryptosporangium arvum TaxID=80871 RepID=UPI0004BA984D|nr:hypothetical protein [Cryptosporangium arvum]